MSQPDSSTPDPSSPKKPSTPRKSAKKPAKKAATSSTKKAAGARKAATKKSNATKKSSAASKASSDGDAGRAGPHDEPTVDTSNDESSTTNPFGLPFTLGGPPADRTSLGDFIRSQRERAELSVRRLAELANVSNPYLSQVERGLRNPSADILQQVASALRISVESLYVRAGILPEDERQVSTIPEAIDHDPNLSDDQKRALRSVYDSFVAGS